MSQFVFTSFLFFQVQMAGIIYNLFFKKYLQAINYICFNGLELVSIYALKSE